MCESAASSIIKGIVNASSNDYTFYYWFKLTILQIMSKFC